jgi:Lsr2/GIY-YIG catalytic domain
MEFEPKWLTTNLAGVLCISEFTFSVYRVFDKQGECLYVGRTADSLAVRFQNHLKADLSQQWIGRATRVDVASFPDQRSMEYGEQASIDELRPRYNQRRAIASPHYGKTNPGPVRRWARENGYEVNTKGRIPPRIIAAYKAANPE